MSLATTNGPQRRRKDRRHGIKIPHHNRIKVFQHREGMLSSHVRVGKV